MTTEIATEQNRENITEQPTSFGHTNASQNDNSKSNLGKRTPIEETPFIMVELDGEHFVTLAQYQLTEKRATQAEAMQDIEKATWTTLINVFDAMLNIREELKNTGGY